MSKIKIITDSASDIPKEFEEKYGIDIRCFPITVGEKSFRDRDIPAEEYYDLIDACPSLPVHSQLTVFEFEELFREYINEGYTDIFYISINSYGSATYSNSCTAKNNIMSEDPGLAEKVNIRLFDSLTYSACYGFPVIEAAKMAQNGDDPDSIEKYLREWFECCEVYLAAYTLRYIKKSGRISAAAAFAGELMGLRPIILLSGDTTKVSAKARGDGNVVPKLADITVERIKEGSPYVVIAGRDRKRAEEAAKELTERLGYPPADINFRVGGAVAANSGPDVVATAFMAKK